MPDQTTYRGAGPSRPSPAGELARHLEARRRQERALRRAQAREGRRRKAAFGALALVTAVALGLSFAGRGQRALANRPSPARRGWSVAAPLLRATPLLGAVTAGRPPSIGFPKMGESAVAFGGSGVVAESARQKPVPIASLTKIMTAYLVLKAHPLVGDEPGPTLRLTAADHQAWIVASERGNSNVEIVRGERLTERQLLEALLIPSADNVADILGRWVSGSDKAFVSLMNQTARQLGLAHTHYADDSGVSQHSVSTPADQAYLASIAMENPVFRSIVALPEVAFPVMGYIWNYNPALGLDGIIGVKSGFTPQAAGCLVTAAWHLVGGRKVLEVAAVTGQRFGLWQAAQVDEALMKAASADVRLVAPFGSRRLIGRLTAGWTRQSAPVGLASALRFAGWGGLRYRGRIVGAALDRREIARGLRPGDQVATLVVSDQFGPAFSVPLLLEKALRPARPGSLGRLSGRVVRVAG